MKLDNLLGLYLYQHKKLNLPGIGTFVADQSTVAPEDNDKYHTQVQGITFKQYASTEPDNELIEFIKMHTGKMKPLAMADLESYLMLVKQFLNIGKPFYIEGIGTLQKITDGTFKFTPGEYLSARLDNNTQESSNATKRKAADENRFTNSDTGRSTARKTMLTLATIATLAVIGWGGYYLYQINTNKEETPPANTVTPMSDTSRTAIQPDSAMVTKDTMAAKRDTAAKTIADTTLRKARPARAIRKVKLVKTDSISSTTTDSTSN